MHAVNVVGCAASCAASLLLLGAGSEGISLRGAGGGRGGGALATLAHVSCLALMDSVSAVDSGDGE